MPAAELVLVWQLILPGTGRACNEEKYLEVYIDKVIASTLTEHVYICLWSASSKVHANHVPDGEATLSGNALL